MSNHMKTVIAILRVPRLWSGDLGEGAVLDGAGDKHVGCDITDQVGAVRCVFNDDNHPENCVPITLQAGENYYIEAIFKEHEGRDNCAVAWQGQGIPQRGVIPGSCLSPVHGGEPRGDGGAACVRMCTGLKCTRGDSWRANWTPGFRAGTVVNRFCPGSPSTRHVTTGQNSGPRHSANLRESIGMLFQKRVRLRSRLHAIDKERGDQLPG